MRILTIGGTGTLGKAIKAELSERHTIISAARHHTTESVDITDSTSIKHLYERIGAVDAVITAVGSVHFGPLEEMTEEKFAIGLKNKLMGQINVVLIGLNYINNSGSFTLTSGILNRDPIRLGAAAAMVNGAIDGFVKSAALEMPRQIRINAVSPTVLTESMSKYENYFRGFIPVSAAQAAIAYSKSIEGLQTGQVYYVQ